jgi:hypothetical protein
MPSVENRLVALWRRWRAPRPVARAMALNWALGTGIGLIGAALALAFDLFGLQALLWRSDLSTADAAMLCVAFAFTFGGLVCAAALMRVDANGDQPRGRRRRAVAEPLRARAPRRG